MRPVILTGDSHLGALKRALDAADDPGLRERVTLWPLGPGGAARQPVHRRDPDSGTVTTIARPWRKRSFSAATLSEPGADALLVVSLPLNTSRILRECSWASHVPWRLAQDDEIPLSEAMMAAMIEADSRHALDFVRDLAALWPATAVLEAPRLFPNADFLARKRAEVCRHVDAAYRAQVRQALEAAGIAVIDQPPETLTPDGMTDLAYDHEDPDDTHHAGTAYGALALQAVLAHAEATGG